MTYRQPLRPRRRSSARIPSTNDRPMPRRRKEGWTISDASGTVSSGMAARPTSALCAVKVMAVWTVAGLGELRQEDRDVDRIGPVAGFEQGQSLPELRFGER